MEKNVTRTHFDYWLLFSTILLLVIGSTMVYSSSAVLAGENFGNGYHFIKRQMIFIFAGFGLMMMMMKMQYQLHRKMAYPLLALGMVAMVFTYIPGVGHEVGGASRWIHFGPISIQPSEFMKIFMIIFLAYALDKKYHRIREFGVGFLPVIIVCSIVIVTILGQKDFGSAFVLGCIMIFMLFVAGTRLVYLVSLFLLSLPVIYVLIASVGYRRQRILAFLDPWQDRYGSGFQIIQSLVAFHEGGLWGKGLGQGQQKLFYLPEAHTDFIFSVLGEELGLLGVLLVVVLFVIFCWRALKISIEAPDNFGKFLAFGLMLLMGIQVVLNLFVVMGLFPTKGLALPLISYGGSSLLASMILAGILLNISTYKRGTVQ